MSRPVFSFRPNPENPEHRRAWEILKRVPEGQKNRFLVRVILQEDLARHLEECVRQAVREELGELRFQQKSAVPEPEVPGVEIPEPEIPGRMLDFLSRMEGGGTAGATASAAGTVVRPQEGQKTGKGGGAVLREDETIRHCQVCCILAPHLCWVL